MEDKRDPRFQIHADLDEVQKDIEKAADERKSEIKQEIKDQKKSLKEEAKELKQEAKDDYKDYKDYKKESDDPLASEKIATAKKASKVVTKGIDIDYNDTKDMIDKEGEMRMESIDRMFDDSPSDSDDTIKEQRERNISDNRIMGGNMTDTTIMGATTLGGNMVSGVSDVGDVYDISDSRNQADNIPPRGQSYEQNREGYLSDNQGQQSGRSVYDSNLSNKDVRREGSDSNRLNTQSNRPGSGYNPQDKGINSPSREYIRPDYEVRDTLITDDESDEFLLIHEERDLRNYNDIRSQSNSDMDNQTGNNMQSKAQSGIHNQNNNDIRNQNDNEIRNDQSGPKKPTYGNKC